MCTCKGMIVRFPLIRPLTVSSPSILPSSLGWPGFCHVAGSRLRSRPPIESATKFPGPQPSTGWDAASSAEVAIMRSRELEAPSSPAKMRSRMGCENTPRTAPPNPAKIASRAQWRRVIFLNQTAAVRTVAAATRPPTQAVREKVSSTADRLRPITPIASPRQIAFLTNTRPSNGRVKNRCRPACWLTWPKVPDVRIRRPPSPLVKPISGMPADENRVIKLTGRCSRQLVQTITDCRLMATASATSTTRSSSRVRMEPGRTRRNRSIFAQWRICTPPPTDGAVKNNTTTQPQSQA